MTAKGIITAGKDNLYPTVQSIQELINFYRSDKDNLKNEKLRLEAELLQVQVDKEKEIKNQIRKARAKLEALGVAVEDQRIE